MALRQVNVKRLQAAYGMWIGGGALAVATAILGGLTAAEAQAHNGTLLELPAADAKGRYVALGTAALITGAVAVVSAAAGFVVYDWNTSQ